MAPVGPPVIDKISTPNLGGKEEQRMFKMNKLKSEICGCTHERVKAKIICLPNNHMGIFAASV